jgi:GNAT superfamily N-acetyltransferase
MWEIVPATGERRWTDLETLFGARGACGGCWCMVWRKRRAAFEQCKGEGNRESLRALVESPRPPGLLAYDGAEVVGWVSIAPRDEFPALDNSRIWKRLDDQPVWSITCFFVRKEWRGRGLTVALIEAACDWARSQGARIVEAYPTEPAAGQKQPVVFVWTGMASAFQTAGFAEVARCSAQRPLMRRRLEGA